MQKSERTLDGTRGEERRRNEIERKRGPKGGAEDYSPAKEGAWMEYMSERAGWKR